MLLLWKYFALGFSALLPLINPLGSALIFLGLVGHAPIAAGPGCIVVMLTLDAHATHATVSTTIIAHLGLFLSAIVLSGGIYFCYAYAPKISSAISPSTAHGILRVIAFILLCIGVQIAWNGLSSLLTPLLSHQQVT